MVNSFRALPGDYPIRPVSLPSRTCAAAHPRFVRPSIGLMQVMRNSVLLCFALLCFASPESK